ncbi:MAG: DUF3168 domain-containing protein [Hyphomicrobiaceae bacterium]|nr:MAG: DUF3168 domain-containing protein [Hyphomicrobiaceae bacterium]
MPSSSWALQQSVFARLSADATLLGLLGGARIYDDVPQAADFPYLTFGQSTVRDWSTATEAGDEHILTLHVWSQAKGRREAHEIMGAVRTALHDQGLSLAGHRLVNMRHEFSEARRDPDGETYHGIVRYRAVTEPA